MTLRISIKNAAFYLRTISTRLPFRFGSFTLEKVPLLHLSLQTESENGIRAQGVAADNLMPKWFDKDPEKSPRDNIQDLLQAAHIARNLYAESGRNPSSVWEIWRGSYPACLQQGRQLGLNSLVSSFGSSLFERALLDAIGKISGRDLVGILRENLAGIRPQDVHKELDYGDILKWASEDPPSSLAVRHTVGLLDPLDTSDLAEEADFRDGLPRTLKEYILGHGLRFFKLKIGGRMEADLDRLRRIASILDLLLSQPYLVTLDGNEQYRSIFEIHRLVERIREDPKLRRFCESIAFIEQPLDRAVSLEPSMEEGLRELSKLCPVIIDESDDRLDAFKTAVVRGYRGVSTKNCKGVMKSFLNRSLIGKWNPGRPKSEELFMTAEDLTNVPVVPLQQDLATVRALGIPHVERNGYHYVRGLAHCSSWERGMALHHHPGLYTERGNEVFVRIVGGYIRVDSLRAPGYGVGFDPDFESMEALLSSLFPLGEVVL
jgi:hypothetical protein